MAKWMQLWQNTIQNRKRRQKKNDQTGFLLSWTVDYKYSNVLGNLSLNMWSIHLYSGSVFPFPRSMHCIKNKWLLGHVKLGSHRSHRSHTYEFSKVMQENNGLVMKVNNLTRMTWKRKLIYNLVTNDLRYKIHVLLSWEALFPRRNVNITNHG